MSSPEQGEMGEELAEMVNLDVSVTDLDKVRQNLEGRLRRAITEISFSGHEPGNIALLVADLRALADIEPLRGAELPLPPVPSVEEQREQQKRAHDEHKRQEERAARRPS